MNNLLIDIINYKYYELPALEQSYKYLLDKEEHNKRSSQFKQAFKMQGPVQIIAEIKPSSPSAGDIFDPTKEKIQEIVKIYDSQPVAAISILTDSTYFNGAFENIAIAREISDKPILCKEFIVDEIQIKIAKYFGADAVLLIAEALDFKRLMELYDFARSISMDVLFECHDPDNLKLLINNNIEIIGINSRDLFSLKVNPRQCYDMKVQIPADRIAIAESGIRTKDDIRQLAEHGFQGVLIGTSILKADDMEKKLKEFVNYDK